MSLAAAGALAARARRATARAEFRRLARGISLGAFTAGVG